MRKFFALVIIVVVGYIAVTGPAHVSSDTASRRDAFVCGVSQSTRSAVHAVGQAVRASAGLVRDNANGPVRAAAQRVTDAPANVAVHDALQGWVTASCD